MNDKLPRCPKCKSPALIRQCGPGWVVTCPRSACTAKTASSPDRQRAIAEFVRPATRWSTR